ncbi:hypothetical protein, partial [Methylobacterium sp. WL12]|uniref:hypothetical protein n=1 Tax=Methylobacterium sp. WL12 TaxID=2603890 RepID=UPI001AEF1275
LRQGKCRAKTDLEVEAVQHRSKTDRQRTTQPSRRADGRVPTLSGHSNILPNRLRTDIAAVPIARVA